MSTEKMNPSTAVEESLLQEIQKQFEFYFSDSNLIRDKFLQPLVLQSDGWVTLETIASFNKVKSMTTDISVVMDAIAKSSALELNEEKDKIRRITPFVPEKVENSFNRTVTAKGLASNDSKQIPDIIAFFSQYGKVTYVQIRKKFDENLAFIEFEKEEDAKKAVEGENIFQEQTLTVFIQKRKEKKDRKEKTDKFVEEVNNALYCENIPHGMERTALTKSITAGIAPVKYIHFLTKSSCYIIFTEPAPKVLELIPEGKYEMGETSLSFRILTDDEKKGLISRKGSKKPFSKRKGIHQESDAPESKKPKQDENKEAEVKPSSPQETVPEAKKEALEAPTAPAVEGTREE